MSRHSSGFIDSFSCTGEAGALRSDRVVLSRPSSLLRPPPTPSRLPTLSRCCRLWPDDAPTPRRGGAEEGLPSSQDNLLTVPRPTTPGGSSALAPGSAVRSMAFALFEQARLLLGPPLGGEH